MNEEILHGIESLDESSSSAKDSDDTIIEPPFTL
jgi:hypothetical protein